MRPTEEGMFLGNVSKKCKEASFSKVSSALTESLAQVLGGGGAGGLE
jgi:hypothetical protein